MKHCRHCDAQIPDEYRRCVHCNRVLSPPATARPAKTPDLSRLHHLADDHPSTVAGLLDRLREADVELHARHGREDPVREPPTRERRAFGKGLCLCRTRRSLAGGGEFTGRFWKHSSHISPRWTHGCVRPASAPRVARRSRRKRRCALLAGWPSPRTRVRSRRRWARPPRVVWRRARPRRAPGRRPGSSALAVGPRDPLGADGRTCGALQSARRVHARAPQRVRANSRASAARGSPHDAQHHDPAARRTATPG